MLQTMKLIEPAPGTITIAGDETYLISQKNLPLVYGAFGVVSGLLIGWVGGLWSAEHALEVFRKTTR